MIQRGRLKALFYINVLVVMTLISYKVYLNFFKPDINAAHTEQLINLENRLAGKDRFSFAVVGNIKNSIGLFEHKIIPILNRSGLDLMVSAGNAVSGPSEDKYRSLNGTLNKLDIPYLLTFGENEADNFGDARFYKHFGPHYYSVKLADNRFIFLDGTGHTSFRWQIEWLKNLLQRSQATQTYIFIGKPLLPVKQQTLFNRDDDYLTPAPFRQQLLQLIDQHSIDIVFSAGLPVYSRQQQNGTVYITTGGAGGLMLNSQNSFYHYVEVTASDQELKIDMVPLEISQHPIFRHLEGLWFFIYSFFFAGLIDFALVVGLLSLVAIRLYVLLFTERDYYRDYDIDPQLWLDKPLRIVMFTNNYLPFVGGVPIAIKRLNEGLRALGHQVLVVAPSYGKGQDTTERDVLRVPSIELPTGKGAFRLPNMLHRPIRQQVRAFKPDVIHLHHPFALGSVGLFLTRRLGVPSIYTYHTRLEHYAHFVPLPSRVFRNLISHSLIRRFTNKCDGVIVPTASTEEYLRIIGVKSSIFVQPTGIEYDQFRQVSESSVSRLKKELNLENQIVIVSASRLSDEKNIDFMIDAVASLRGHVNKSFCVLLIGEGHQREYYQQRIERLELADHFQLIGQVPPEDIPVYFHLGDIFAFTSKSESQGMVILEAMAAGLPVIAVRSSGIDDVIQEGHTGFKTPEKIDRWRDALMRLINDPALRTQLGQHAQAYAKGYSVDHYARNIQLIYAEIIAASKS